MADLFKCDHCQSVLVKTEKAGVIIVQQCVWGQNGIQFPNRPLHQHDLCKPCLATLLEMATRKPKTSQTMAIEKVTAQTRTRDEYPIPTVEHAKAAPLTKIRQLKQWFEHKLVFNTNKEKL